MFFEAVHNGEKMHVSNICEEMLRHLYAETWNASEGETYLCKNLAAAYRKADFTKDQPTAAKFFLDAETEARREASQTETGASLEDSDSQRQTQTTEPTIEKVAEPSYAESLDEYNLRMRTNKICHVLASPKVSEDTKEAFRSIILEAANEAGISGGGDPELVKIAFPKIIKALDFEYGRGIYHALTSLLDSNLVAPIEDELEQYSKRFDSIPEKTEQKEVLDLSEMCGDFLRTNEATAGEKPIPLSVLLSAVMKHPDICQHNFITCLATSYAKFQRVLPNSQKLFNKL